MQYESRGLTGLGNHQRSDPEIPVISLVDLGVIRGIEWQGDTLVVKITPTYSGCPATSIIGFGSWSVRGRMRVP